MKKFIVSLLVVAGLLIAACTTAQIEAAKPTAISLAQPAGFAVGQYFYQHNPALAAKILPDVEAFLSDVLTKNTPVLSSDVTVWVSAETSKLGLSAADATALDNLALTNIVALQAQYQTDLTNKLGTTATQVLTNFELGLAQATSVQPVK